MGCRLLSAAGHLKHSGLKSIMFALGLIQLGLNRLTPRLPALSELSNGLNKTQHFVAESVNAGTYRFGNRIRAVTQEFLEQGEFLFALLGFIVNGFPQVCFCGFG